MRGTHIGIRKLFPLGAGTFTISAAKKDFGVVLVGEILAAGGDVRVVLREELGSDEDFTDLWRYSLSASVIAEERVK